MKEREKERGVPERLKQEVQRRKGRGGGGISEGRATWGVESWGRRSPCTHQWAEGFLPSAIHLHHRLMVYSRSNCWWIMSSADTHQQQPQPSHAERRLFAPACQRVSPVVFSSPPAPRSRRRLLGSDLQPFALHLLQRGLEIHQLQHTGWVRTPARLRSRCDHYRSLLYEKKKKSLSVYWNGKAAKITTEILLTLSFWMTGWRIKFFHLCSGCRKALKALLLCLPLSHRFTILLQHGLPHSPAVCSRLRPPLVPPPLETQSCTKTGLHLEPDWMNFELQHEQSWECIKTKSRTILSPADPSLLFIYGCRCPCRVTQPHVYTFQPCKTPFFFQA